MGGARRVCCGHHWFYGTCKSEYMRLPFVYLIWFSQELIHEDFNLPRSDKSDIWEAALTIWVMMHTALDIRHIVNRYLGGDEGEGNDKDKSKEKDKKKRTPFYLHENVVLRFLGGDTLPLGQDPTDKSTYSHALTSLVTDCLKIDPRRRPGFWELRCRVIEEMARLPRLVGPFHGRDIPAHLQLKYLKEDMFKIGTIAQFRKRPREDGETGQPRSKRTAQRRASTGPTN